LWQDWTTQISLIRLSKFDFARTGFLADFQAAREAFSDEI
jgi:hypothetical protein